MCTHIRLHALIHSIDTYTCERVEEHGDVDVPPAQRHHHLLSHTSLNLTTTHTLIHSMHTHTFYTHVCLVCIHKRLHALMHSMNTYACERVHKQGDVDVPPAQRHHHLLAINEFQRVYNSFTYV